MDRGYCVDDISPELYIGKKEGIKKDTKFWLCCPACDDKLLEWKDPANPPVCATCQSGAGVERDFWARYPADDEELAEIKEVADDRYDFSFFGADDPVMKFIDQNKDDFHISSAGTTKYECQIVCRRCDCCFPIAMLDKAQRHARMKCHKSKDEFKRPEKEWERWDDGRAVLKKSSPQTF